MNSASVSLILFAVAAVLGLVILLKWMKHKKASRAVIFAHGAVAVLALVVLIYFAMSNTSRFPVLALSLFGLAAVAGIYMFIRDLNHKDSPVTLAVLHGVVALTGFAALLFCVFG